MFAYLKKIFPFKTQMMTEYHVELCFCIYALHGNKITQVALKRTNNRSLNLWHKAWQGMPALENKFKKNHRQIYIKHIGENNGLLGLFFFFLRKLRIYLWKVIRKADNCKYYLHFFKCYLLYLSSFFSLLFFWPREREYTVHKKLINEFLEWGKAS